MKYCTDCKLDLDESLFYKNKARPDGLCNRCKNCEKIRKTSDWSISYHKEYSTKYAKTDKCKEYHKNRYIELKDKYRESYLKWVDNNPDRAKELWRKHSKKAETKIRHNITEANRRARKLHATIEGFEEEIESIYRNRPDGYHVDHIIPLKGKNVCGLHVPWNLQYLTAEENIKKNNKLEDKYTKETYVKR